MHIVCPHCNAVNRIPSQRLADNPKCGKCANPLFTAKPLELAAPAFQQHLQRSDIPLLVDFWAPWCGPCKMLTPTIEALAEDYEGKIKVVKVNVDDNQELAAKYGIRGIPTVMVFKDGEVHSTMVGLQPREQLAEAIDNVL